MSFKKTMLAVVAVSALTAATAVPAMALENEFHGLYRLRAITSNYENAAGGVLKNDAATLNVFEQRARLMYVAKASDDLLVTHFEIDSSWGDAAYQNGRGVGGGAGADSVNMETKNVYLDFKIPSTPVNAKVGIQGFTDAYKGIFFNNDAAGALLSGKTGPTTITGGYFRLNDGGGASTIGKANIDLYVLDGKFAVSKDLSVGGSYYLVRNDLNYSGQDLHMVGVNAAANIGPVAVDGFAIFQGGDEIYAPVGKTVTAFAAQVAAKAKMGPGALRGAVLYTSGDGGTNPDDTHAFQNIMESAGATPTTFTASGSNYYSADMLLLMRSKWAMDSDKAIVSTANNANQGLILGAVGFDASLSSKLSATANVGFGMDAHRNAATGRNSKVIGTEVNVQVNYKVYDNLMASLQGAYVLLGGRSTSTDDPFLGGAMLNYTF